MNFQAIRQHFSHHRLHMVGCGFAALLVVVAIVFSLPALAILGALMCGTMMIAMAWMMVGMTANHRR
jgi:hypothetical protein